MLEVLRTIDWQFSKEECLRPTPGTLAVDFVLSDAPTPTVDELATLQEYFRECPSLAVVRVNIQGSVVNAGDIYVMVTAEKSAKGVRT